MEDEKKIADERKTHQEMEIYRLKEELSILYQQHQQLLYNNSLPSSQYEQQYHGRYSIFPHDSNTQHEVPVINHHIVNQHQHYQQQQQQRKPKSNKPKSNSSWIGGWIGYLFSSNSNNSHESDHHLPDDDIQIVLNV